MNSSVLLKKLCLLLKAVGKKKSLDLDSFTDEFHQTFKEKITTSLHNFFQEIEEVTLPKSFYKTRITLTRRPDTNSTKTNQKNLQIN